MPEQAQPPAPISAKRGYSPLPESWQKFTPYFVLGLMFVSGAFLMWRQNVPRPATVRVGEDVVVRVEVADTEQKRNRGLSGHAPLADDEGMYFVFDEAGKYSFWMNEMTFALDLIWIEDDEIVDITTDVPPPAPGQTELPTYSPVTAADRVLEVNAGFAKKHGLKLGMPVKLNR